MAYYVPACQQQTELEVARSRFITTVGFVDSVEAARQMLKGIREEMPDANHHVYTYRIGYGNSVIEGMSDDGEPTGTAAPPTLSVLRGYEIGDVILVTSRYFGGTKLGTGGLVRAYSEAAHIALNKLPTVEKVQTCTIGIQVPYGLHKSVRKAVVEHQAQIEDETFAADITIIAILPCKQLIKLTQALKDLSSGKVYPIRMDE